MGPKRKPRVRKSRNENLSISAALLLVTALSAASSSLSASVIASLMSSIIRTARTGAGQDAASLTAQQTHTHPSPMPSCLEARRAGFLNCISKQKFVAEFVKQFLSSCSTSHPNYVIFQAVKGQARLDFSPFTSFHN